MPQLIRFDHPDSGVRIGLLDQGQIRDVTDITGSIARWLQHSAGRVAAAIEDLIARSTSAVPVYDLGLLRPPALGPMAWLAPVDSQDIWAAGVTYQRSREARQAEAIDGGDVYARVYRAARPELFFKAHGARVIGPWGEVGIRADATWNVPEPELALVLNPALEVVGMTIGNDMSSRDLEGENPLYLPQAKVYEASCALGPGIVLGSFDQWPSAAIRLIIEREQQIVFEGQVHTDQLHRRLDELVTYLGRSNRYPDGVVLLTGTGVVPPAEFTLARGDVVRIAIEGIGELVNTVKVV
jgi:2-dehydro-3-deoxy-D-arabinonate dehydratase